MPKRALVVLRAPAIALLGVSLAVIRGAKLAAEKQPTATIPSSSVPTRQLTNALHALLPRPLPESSDPGETDRSLSPLACLFDSVGLAFDNLILRESHPAMMTL